jgi:RNA-binding protein
MLTSKERAALKSRAMTEDTIILVGKGGISDEIIAGAASAVAARELIKGKILETCPITAAEAAEAIASGIGAEVVQVIGGKFVLYKVNPDKDKPRPKKLKNPAKKPPVKPKKMYLKEKKRVEKSFKRTGIKKPLKKTVGKKNENKH